MQICRSFNFIFIHYYMIAFAPRLWHYNTTSAINSRNFSPTFTIFT